MARTMDLNALLTEGVFYAAASALSCSSDEHSPGTRAGISWVLRSLGYGCLLALPLPQWLTVGIQK